MRKRIHPYGDMTLKDAVALIRRSMNGMKLEAIALFIESLAPQFDVKPDLENDSAKVVEETAAEFRDRIAHEIRRFDPRFKETNGVYG